MRTAQQLSSSGDSDTDCITAAQLAAAHDTSRASVSADQAAHFDEIEAAFATGGVAETSVQAASRAAAAQRVRLHDADLDQEPCHWQDADHDSVLEASSSYPRTLTSIQTLTAS